ncbi:hypothetical protein [Shewanella sp. YLB-07]|uniref:hypothetical protein n=1 Tax=Shewanella sp. YLB-07 TaxID=2601268 RepID=UPI00128C1BA5|nr:hypothetical protein [Shewanella sp. YLB-07]MPY25066.1 hypothetical protein [Shewanella sp. YLB-07]
MINVNINNDKDIVNISEIQLVITGLLNANCSTTDAIREIENIATATRDLDTADFAHVAAYYHIRTQTTLNSICSIHIGMCTNGKLIFNHQ